MERRLQGVQQWGGQVSSARPWVDDLVHYEMNGWEICVALFRIVVVKQTRDFLSPLNNFTLIDVVLKSILPDSHHLLSAEEVSYAIETHLQTRGENIWPSWTVRAIHAIKPALQFVKFVLRPCLLYVFTCIQFKSLQNMKKWIHRF